MAVLHGRDLLSSKYITAIIKDASKRLWFIPIKNMIGSYFLAEINHQIYCFKIDSEICQYREKLTKQFQVIIYDTTHYRPIKSEVKELETLLRVNNLPKVDGMLASILRLLGSKEKKDFDVHRLKDMIGELSQYDEGNVGKTIGKAGNIYAAQIDSIVQYLKNLHIEEIVTPVRSISDYIEDDLRATDAKFLGTIVSTVQSLDFENKKVTNSPIKSTIAWAKWGLAIMMIAMVVVVIAYGNDQGWFSGLIPDLSGVGGLGDIMSGGLSPPGVKNDQYYQDNYTPEELRAAIDRGEIDESTLPKATREMVANIEPPKVTPTP